MMETKENIELGKKEYVNIYFLTSKDADVSFSKKKKQTQMWPRKEE